MTLFRTTYRQGTPLRIAVLALVIAGLLAASCKEQAPRTAPDFAHNPRYRHYLFSQDDKTIVIGVPTPWGTIGQIVEVMKRDELLRRALARIGYRVRFLPFLKGEDINYFLAQGSLEGAIMGDMPTLTAAMARRIRVLSFVHTVSVSLVSRDVYRVRDLRHCRVAYPAGSIAHYYLLRLLAELGLPDDYIRWTPMDADAMFPAVETGRIDAFTTFEPTATIYQRLDPTLHTINRSFARSGLFSMRADYVARHRDAALAIVAAQFRAVAWLRASDRHLHRASRWLAAESAQFLSLPLADHLAVLDTLCREDLLGSTPAYLETAQGSILGPQGALHREFDFLEAHGLLPRDRTWQDFLRQYDSRAVPDALATGSIREAEIAR